MTSFLLSYIWISFFYFMPVGSRENKFDSLISVLKSYSSYDNIHFMNAFKKTVVLFYEAEVLSEERVLKWYKDEQGEVTGFCVWLSSFPSPMHWRDSSFPVAYSLLLWCKWIDRVCVDLLLDPLFCSIDLYVCFYANTILFWLWLICSKVWNKKCDVTSLVLLSKDLFWLFRVLVSQILGLFVLFLWKMPLKFW